MRPFFLLIVGALLLAAILGVGMSYDGSYYLYLRWMMVSPSSPTVVTFMLCYR